MLNRRAAVCTFIQLVVFTTGLFGAKAERVAVLKFFNSITPRQMSAADVGFLQVDPRYNYLEMALTEMTITDLAGFRCVQLVERIKVEDMLGEIRLDASGAVDPATAMHAGHALEADHLIHGDIRMDDGLLHIQPYIDSRPWATTRMLTPVTADEKQVFELETKLTQIFRDALCRSDARFASPASIPHAATLAILPFRDNSKVPLETELRATFSDIAAAELSRNSRFRLVERSRLHEVLEEMRFQDSGVVDVKTAVRAGQLAGAQYILFGSLVRSGPTIRIDARIIGVETSATPYYWEVHGPVHHISELTAELIRRMIRDLDPLKT